MHIIHQKGVGLVEVLVALLLLALGIFGFIALQYKAGEATAEATQRIQAMNIARDLAERIRINNKANIDNYKATDFQKEESCFDSFCDPSTKTKFDLYQVKLLANRFGMNYKVQNCPNSTTQNNRKCVYVAWDKTQPENTTQSDTNACTKSTSAGFSYNDASTCIVLEIYQ